MLHCSLLLVTWLYLLVSAGGPLSAESKKIRTAYLHLQQAPNSALAQRAYLAAFPATKAAFVQVFFPADFEQLYENSHDYLNALRQVSRQYPRETLRKCLHISKHLTWDADAIGDLQGATVEIGGAHPRAFAVEARRLPPAEQKSLFRFLADVENHDAYKAYPLLVKRLQETGAADLAAMLQQAKERRVRQPRH